VKDDRSLSEQLLPSLRDKDLTSDVAADVVEAKRLLARNQYKVVVLDLMLPDGTGFDGLDFIHAERLTPSIVVVTVADRSLLVKLDRAVVKTIMFKPFDVEHLASYVHTLTLARSSDIG
jgi:DNA-binding response OmpR family regulator